MLAQAASSVEAQLQDGLLGTTGHRDDLATKIALALLVAAEVVVAMDAQTNDAWAMARPHMVIETIAVASEIVAARERAPYALQPRQGLPFLGHHSPFRPAQYSGAYRGEYGQLFIENMFCIGYTALPASD